MTILTEITSSVVMDDPVKTNEIGMVDMLFFESMRDGSSAAIRACHLLQFQTNMIMKGGVLFKGFKQLNIVEMNLIRYFFISVFIA